MSFESLFNNIPTTELTIERLAEWELDFILDGYDHPLSTQEAHVLSTFTGIDLNNMSVSSIDELSCYVNRTITNLGNLHFVYVSPYNTNIYIQSFLDVVQRDDNQEIPSMIHTHTLWLNKYTGRDDEIYVDVYAKKYCTVMDYTVNSVIDIMSNVMKIPYSEMLHFELMECRKNDIKMLVSTAKDYY